MSTGIHGHNETGAESQKAAREKVRLRPQKKGSNVQTWLAAIKNSRRELHDRKSSIVDGSLPQTITTSTRQNAEHVNILDYASQSQWNQPSSLSAQIY